MSNQVPPWQDIRFLRFLLVGGICFLTNLLVLYLGTELLGFHYLVSMGASICIANSLGWALNRSLTFGATSGSWLSEYIRYFSVNLIGFTFTLVATAVLVSVLGMHYLIASAGLAAFMTLFNFVAHRDWSFRS